MELQTYLKEHDIGVTAFAKKAKMKQPFISLIINKKRKPSANTAKKISKATRGKVTILELLFP